MVKGTTRRVIVVKAPDPRYFEEAIFIVKADACLKGVDPERALKEAQIVAGSYIKTQAAHRRILRRIPPLGYLAMGALLSAGMMALAGFLF
ncbi:MAG: translation initiation factor 2 [Oscillospiraceae bacterium]|nr:translation initiation factor 2 [Oscillospiraceae bacterium]